MKELSERIIKNRWWIITGFTVLTLLLGFQIRNATIDTNMKSQLPKKMPSRVDTDKIDELFGGTEMLMVLIQSDDVLNPETLKRCKKIARGVNRVKGEE